jgi:CDP-diacylglycerol--serine O-phosphatidyltransferase
MPYLGFLVPLFSAWRLAKFNIDPRQQMGFIGLPTPANALFIGSLPLIAGSTAIAAVREAIGQPWVLVGLTLLLSFLLVSPLRLFALKFKDYSWAANRVRYVFLGLSVLLLAVLQVAAIPPIIALYVGLSVLIRSDEPVELPSSHL